MRQDYAQLIDVGRIEARGIGPNFTAGEVLLIGHVGHEALERDLVGLDAVLAK